MTFEGWFLNTNTNLMQKYGKLIQTLILKTSEISSHLTKREKKNDPEV